ncbi:MAG: hypothetical protein QOI16_1294, partial [Pseudonocardiales bacterium]|nr:hypothetical protein [Pseudonocardiales bacterium]
GDDIHFPSWHEQGCHRSVGQPDGHCRRLRAGRRSCTDQPYVGERFSGPRGTDQHAAVRRAGIPQRANGHELRRPVPQSEISGMDRAARREIDSGDHNRRASRAWGRGDRRDEREQNQ